MSLFNVPGENASIFGGIIPGDDIIFVLMANAGLL
jgi:hypothetical protein